MDTSNTSCYLIFSMNPERKITQYILTYDLGDIPGYIEDEMYDKRNWLDKRNGTVVNNTVVMIDFKYDDAIKNINKDNYASMAEDVIRNPQKYGATKIKALPFLDIFYCMNYCKDPTEKENEHDKIMWDASYMTFARKHDNPTSDNQSLCGIRTDLGIHLFSRDKAGEDALEQCLNYYLRHFFSKNRGTDRMEIVSAIPVGEMPQPAGNSFNAMKILDIAPLDLPKEFFNTGCALLEIPERKFDMLPTIQNALELRTENRIIELNLTQELHDYSCLGLFYEGLVQSPIEMHMEFGWEFSYEHNFDDLVNELDDCDTPAERVEVSERIRTLAGQLIEEKFPDWRYCQTPGNIEKQLYQHQEFPEQSPKHGLKF